MSAEAIRVSGRRAAARLFVHQLRSEQLVFWRSREAAFFIFLFPLLLFVLLGSVYSGTIDGVPVAVGCPRRAHRLRLREHRLRRARDPARAPARERNPEAAPLDAAAAGDVRRRAPRLDADRLRAADDRAVPARARVLRDAVSLRHRLVRRDDRDRRGGVRRARHGDRVRDPLGRGVVGGRQLHPPADGVPQRRVRADPALSRPSSARSATCCRSSTSSSSSTPSICTGTASGRSRRRSRSSPAGASRASSSPLFRFQWEPRER